MTSSDDGDSKRNSPRKMSPTRGEGKQGGAAGKKQVGAPSYGATKYGFDDDDARKREFDTYRAEARTRATAGKHDQAIEMYNKAVELQPQNTDCLIARATCHLQVCDFDSAVSDADRAIQVNPKMAKANYIKAEALYQKGEFEMALVCYHRARRLRPGASEYDRGIKKAEGAIEISIGDANTSKLVRKGDLSYFENQKSLGDRSVELLARQSSAARREAISRDHSERRRRTGSGRDARTVKHLLEELYGDWKYLERILNDEDRLLQEIEDEALNEETKRRRLIKERREALKGNNPYKQVEEDDDKLVPPDSFGEEMRRKKKEFCEGIKDFAQKELSYLGERAEFWMQQKTSTPPRKKEVQSAGNSRTAEILRALEDLEDAQTSGQHQESLRRAQKLLEKVEKASDRDVKNKEDIIGTLHSLIGNAHLELGKFDQALLHHKRSLANSEQTANREAKSRSLDNLGRTYARKGDYTNAIKIFEQKVPMLSTPLESTWLYHELGRCYLETGNYPEAKTSAEKACHFATHTDDKAWQLNASVLLAQSEVELRDYTASLDAFERALEIAKLDDDEAAIKAISKAINDVNKKIIKLEREKDRKKEADKKKNSIEEEDEKDVANENVKNDRETGHAGDSGVNGTEEAKDISDTQSNAEDDDKQSKGGENVSTGDQAQNPNDTDEKEMEAVNDSTSAGEKED